MFEPTQAVARLGGIAQKQRILALGVPGSALLTAVRHGSLFRPMQGWYALPDADQDVIRAVRLGGCLGCVSAAGHHGLATPPGNPLHVWVPPGASRLRTPADKHARFEPATDRSATLHWNRLRGVSRHSLVLPLQLALFQIAECMPLDYAVAIFDSALNRKKISPDALSSVIGNWPVRLHALRNYIDGRAESFPESIFRVRLRLAGVTCRIQVRALDAFRLDVVIGDRLLVEINGLEFHGNDRFEADHDRGALLSGVGFIILRFTYRQVLFDWPTVWATISAAIERGDHLTHTR
jgi:very-short-patch-repair endonuclease